MINSFLFPTDIPLAPENVIVNVTKHGYYVAWTYSIVPDRPDVEKFVVEYRVGRESSTWIKAADAVPADRRVYLFSVEMAEENKAYDFRVFAYGANEFSEPAYVTKRYNIGKLGIEQVFR